MGGIGARFTAPGSGIADFAALGSYFFRMQSAGTDDDVFSRATIFINVFDDTTQHFVLQRSPIADNSYYHDYPLVGENGPLSEEGNGSFSYGETHRRFNVEKDHQYAAWIWTFTESNAHVREFLAWSWADTWFEFTVALIHVYFIL